MSEILIKKIKRLAKWALSLLINSKIVVFEGLKVKGAFQDFGLLHELSRGHREPLMTKLFSCLLKPGVVFWDVGAHLGVYSLLAAKLENSKILALEPNPRTFRYLEQNITLNRFVKKIQPLPIALTASSGLLNFFCDELESDVSSLVTLENPGQLKSVEIEAMTLDQLLRKHGTPPDIMKIDVEGAELSVLQGGSEFWNRVKEKGSFSLFIESNAASLIRGGTSPREMLDHLVQLGLSVMLIDETTGQVVPVDGRIEEGCWNLFCTYPAT